MSKITSRSRALVALAVTGAIGVVLLYLAFVRLPIGQRWDDRALLGGQLATLEARQALTAALHGIRISTIVLMIGLIVLIGIVRKRVSATIITVVAIGGAIVSAEVLKRVLPRRDLAPELNAYVDNGNIDTYPSGHSTIAMAFALGLLIVTSPRYRTAVATIGMLWAAAIPMAALAAGWHRPSDVLGGMALALMWLSAAGAIVVMRHPDSASSVSPRHLAAIAGVILAACTVALGLWIWWGDPSQVPVGGGFIAFTVAALGIAVTAVAIVGIYATTLGRGNPAQGA